MIISIINHASTTVTDAELEQGRRAINRQIEGHFAPYGTTNDGGSREGVGVFRRTGRRVRDINVGFIDYGAQ